MKKNTRLGCFTTAGILAAILTALIVAGFAFASGGMLFSPGALSARTGTSMSGDSSHNARANASLGGVNSHAEIAGQCNRCHAPFWSTDTMGDRCVACHTDVTAQWQDPATLHGALRQNNPTLACHNCHPDHRGADSPLVDLSNANFPHNSFGFMLSGHRFKPDGSAFSCNDCHAQVYTSFDPNICTTCHFQVNAAFLQSHVLDFGTDCMACHDGVETYGHNFDHNSVSFPLAGKHAQVQCAKCHINTRILADLKSTPQDCSSCHALKDAHQGRLGADCGSCHTPDGWSPAAFDHNLAAFKLTGKHTTVTCEKCHIDHVLQGTPLDCVSCHALKDPHQGRLGTDCGSCHTTDGWTPAAYDHNLSAFKLIGQHATTACEKCHINHVLQGTPMDCYSCHAGQDTHKGSLGTACSTCHSPAAWKPSTFDHNQSAFKLTGQHNSVTCLKCHVNNVFRGTPNDCYSCHAAIDSHKGSLGTSCSTCHSTDGWKPATFDHNLSAFKLTGQHTTVACLGCHVNNVFKGTPNDCYSCHARQDNHNGQFGTSCATCHSTSGWKPATFDHNLSAFKLTGQHTTVACLGCHVNGVFKGTSGDCYSCHARQDNHGGQLGTNCGSCHSTSGWKPATFDHSTSGFPLTGSHATVACSGCHANNVFKGTPRDCYSCHARQDNHGGQFGTSCGTCHSTSGWKPATFDHNLSGFKLTGRHTTVSCSGCHANGVFKGTPSDCYSCHAGQDNHGGQFGTNCGSCHTTSGWLPATFDHNLSSFKLTGRHTSVACSGCHANGVFKGTPSTCYACHAGQDQHNGGFGTNCGSCHSTSSWSGASFDHNLSSFKLTGRHTSVACSGCHANGVFKGTPSTCYACHAGQDQHNGGFGTNCGSCHSTSGWSGASFDHSTSGFPLTGAHSGLTCTRCHSGGTYGGLSPTCVSCHSEPANHFGSNCAQCHTTNNWNASLPPHPNTCDGDCASHRRATCADCHPNNYTTYTCLKCHDSNKPGD